MFRKFFSNLFLPDQSYLLMLLALGVFTGGVLSCSNPSDTFGQADYGQNFKSAWAQDKFWDDGLAEVAIYEAQRVVYNKSRQFEYTLITVKEDFNKAFNVKTDDYQRKDLFPVMKVNEFARIPTDNYPYHYLTSLFFKRENPLILYKLTSSSQEWCGTTFKAINQIGNFFNYQFNSYWDNQGTGELKLKKLALFEDQLPYTLRSLKFAENLKFSAPVYELQQTSKATPPQLYQAQFKVSRSSDSKFASGAWLVTVQLNPDKQSQYWFDTQYPHALLRQKSYDGRTLELKSIRRYAYWQH
ncbi:hypothetical protein [Adhaeribacter pallidiroseus]|uniref:Septum formation inhibitor Maf n=1 Tax=Adhaeribacter pallidiroseus TaxID=2072847 RepID=A0A369QD16_9BACT|nr:hypothetical protein [Adhaeribacter pallidiroseus]RDC62803.1 hypothetical protein AHMF7616_01397 [Adhaeribacter pallidiroseus]